MKEFFKFTLATITGIIVSSVVLFFVSILILFSMLSSSESETQVRKNSVMMLDMRGMLSERSQDNPFDIFLSEDETTDWMTFFRLSRKPRKMKTSREFTCKPVQWA